MSGEEPKSVSEVYIRVAVMDTATIEGITNIYIGCEKKLVPFVAHTREERTALREANIRRRSTAFRINRKENLRFKFK
jgi:hypothetical protein